MSLRRSPRAGPFSPTRPSTVLQLLGSLATASRMCWALGQEERRRGGRQTGGWAAQKLTSRMSPSSSPAAPAESPGKTAAPRTPRGCPASGAQQGIATVRDRATQATRLKRPCSRSSPECPTPRAQLVSFLPSARPLRLRLCLLSLRTVFLQLPWGLSLRQTDRRHKPCAL